MDEVDSVLWRMMRELNRGGEERQRRKGKEWKENGDNDIVVKIDGMDDIKTMDEGSRGGREKGRIK